MAEQLTPERWRKIADVLDEILELPVKEQAERLRVLGEEDADLRAKLETLLGAGRRRGLLDLPAGDYLATLMEEIEVERAADGKKSRPTLGTYADARFLPGTLLAGRYRIATRLGRGGMGEVFRADDLKLGQTVALKFLPAGLSENAELETRFLQEVKLARQIAHPNVCRVYDLGDADGQPFLSMEFVQGEDLASLLKRIGRLPREKAIQIAQQLCAGLAAAHAEGILHRDLKPANVMLDERGRVRITDFGLAQLAETATSADALAGTPAYMAPEQLAAGRVSKQSDLYALGMVLYELFTGRRAFAGTSAADPNRAQAESRPEPLSSYVDGVDPVIERAILRCLEPEPANRPTSAAEVAAALPGGDPLAAALAAGETPSPEIVAAAGPDRGLTPKIAALGLALTAVALMAAVALLPPASIIGLVPWTKTPAALDGEAREILTTLGYTEAPGDRARRFAIDPDYLAYLKRTDATAARWRPLEIPGQLAFRFGYRESAAPLLPSAESGRVVLQLPGFVQRHDPPLASGDAFLVTDLRGRLRYLQAIPAATVAVGKAPEAGESLLFAAARLDISRFEPVEPVRQPPVAADRRLAWAGALEEVGDLPVRIEAAFSAGRPVFFEVVYPFRGSWDPTADGDQPTADEPTSWTQVVIDVFWAAWILSLLVAPVLLAVRNQRLGRGDRRGAGRLAKFVFALRLVWWVFGGHHVTDLWGELGLLGGALARSLFVAAAIWVLYIAIEPYARRLWPRMLVSWSRLLDGRFADPLVGRDLLFGVLWGLLMAPLGQGLYFLVPRWLAWPQPPKPLPHPFWTFFAPSADPLLGTRDAIAAVGSALMAGLWGTLGLLTLLIALLALLRRRWLAILAFVLLMAPNHWAVHYTDFHWLGLAISIVFFGSNILILVRVGVLMTAIATSTFFVLSAFPLTADPSLPFFGTSLFALALVATTAVYGAWRAVGKQRWFAGSSAPFE